MAPAIMRAVSCWFFGILAVVLFGCASRSYEPPWNPTRPTARLVELMGERLIVSQDIAWAKYREGLPVQDRRREREVLRAAVAQARKLGISPGRAKAFFQAQLAASREVQSELIRSWKQGQALPARAPKSLERELRPRMDQLTSQLVVQLAAVGETARGRELARQAERYFLALGIPRDPALKAIRPLR